VGRGKMTGVMKNPKRRASWAARPRNPTPPPSPATMR
jgi:hypothetical protein